MEVIERRQSKSSGGHHKAVKMREMEDVSGEGEGEDEGEEWRKGGARINRRHNYGLM